MLGEPARIRVEPESVFPRLLETIGETPVVLENEGKLHRLVKEEDSTVGYDPAAVKAAIRKTAGSWSDIDADQFIADRYRAREEGTRPINRP